MAVLLNSALGYKGYLAGTVINLPVAEEAALVAQNLATVSAVASTTTGAVVANVPQGICAFAAGAGSLVITNSLVNASSIITAYVSQAAADGSLLYIARVVAAAGSFTLYGNTTATATTLVAWKVEPQGQAGPQ